MPDQRALAAAMRLISCDWGTKVKLPDDREVCTREARRYMAIHGHADEVHVLQVCDEHAAIIERETDPHA